MRIFKILAVSGLFLLVTGCTCKPHKKIDTLASTPATSDNIDTAQKDGPLKDVFFSFDSYALSAPAKSVLKTNADWLMQNPSKKAVIEGHCDERGTSEYNMVLGANRAKAGLDYLRSLGISPQRLSTVSYGEDLPLDPSHSEEAWAKNRRDHFKVE